MDDGTVVIRGKWEKNKIKIRKITGWNRILDSHIQVYNIPSFHPRQQQKNREHMATRYSSDIRPLLPPPPPLYPEPIQSRGLITVDLQVGFSCLFFRFWFFLLLLLFGWVYLYTRSATIWAGYWWPNIQHNQLRPFCLVNSRPHLFFRPANLVSINTVKSCWARPTKKVQ